jgi:hypothetical protein
MEGSDMTDDTAWPVFDLSGPKSVNSADAELEKAMALAHVGALVVHNVTGGKYRKGDDGLWRWVGPEGDDLSVGYKPDKVSAQHFSLVVSEVISKKQLHEAMNAAPVGTHVRAHYTGEPTNFYVKQEDGLWHLTWAKGKVHHYGSATSDFPDWYKLEEPSWV